MTVPARRSTRGFDPDVRERFDRRVHRIIEPRGGPAGAHRTAGAPGLRAASSRLHAQARPAASGDSRTTKRDVEIAFRNACVQPADTEHGRYNGTPPRGDETAARRPWSRLSVPFEGARRGRA
ncbi:hypothetical protein CMZ84_13650 [Lysobacteraceae bacterium NML93-0399]|nr:hypothetical protein CMZ84_13650 [Xanthomonadaceae bacterium NML93-0399]